MKKQVLIWVAVFYACFLTCRVQASVSGISLTKRIDPREFGMSNAGTAAADDEYAIYDNPAGLSYLSQSRLGVAYGTGLLDDSLAQIIYANAANATGTWALGLRNYNLCDFNYVDFNGNSTRLKSQSDWILDAAYASRPGSIFRYGFSFKVLHSELLESLKATTVALDLGTTFDVFEGFRIASVLQNLGLPLSYSDDSKDSLGLPFKGGETLESLPLTFKTGLSYKFLNSRDDQPGHDLQAVVNLVEELEKPYVVNAGLEYRFYKIIALRGGYSFGDSLDGFSFGAGLQYPVFANLPMQLDYSLQLSKELNYQHKLALSLGFAPNPNRTNGALVSRLMDDYGPSQMKIGFGLGGSFGGPGINLEYMTNDYIGIFGGLGLPAAFSSDYGAGGSAGARFYFGNPCGKVRGRGSIYATAISSDDGVIVFLANTIGLEWRIFETLSLDLDAGAAVGDASGYPLAIPMADLGLVIHVCGKPPIKEKIPSEKISTEEPHGLTVSILPSAAKNQEMLSYVFMEKFKIFTSEDQIHVVSGTVFNHSEHEIKNLAVRLAFYDTQGNTLSSWNLSLIRSGAVETASQPLEGNSQRKLVFETGESLPGYSGVSLQIIGINEELNFAPLAPPAKAVVHESNAPQRNIDKKRDFSSTAMAVPKLGLGIGSPYGMLGGDFELMLGQLIGLYGGVGTVVVSPDTGYQVGARVYLLPADFPFRLRVGLGYGSAGFFIWQSSSGTTLHSEVTNGIQPALGFEWRFSRHVSLNFDVLYQFLEKHDAVYSYSGSNYKLHLNDGPSAALGVNFIFPGNPGGGKKNTKSSATGDEK